MERFTSAEIVQESRNKAHLMTRILIVAAAAMLILLIALCLLTRTGNARTMLIIAMVCSVVGGWSVMAFWIFSVEPARAEARHLEGLAAETAQTREGWMTLDPEGFRIPKSVWVLKAKLNTGEETLSLNLNEKYGDRVPPDGSLVRVETAKKFIIGMETLEKAEEQTPRKQPSAWKKFRRRFGKFFPGAVIWTMVAVMLTGFVFTRITDTDPAHKITIYADCKIHNAAELAEKLEKGMDGAVKMVKVHPFSFALFGSEQLKSADLYIVPDSRKNDYSEWLGEDTGKVMADPDSGISVAGEYFRYNEGEKEPSVFRLYNGLKSVHAEDGLAEKAAELLTTFGTGE